MTRINVMSGPLSVDSTAKPSEMHEFGQPPLGSQVTDLLKYHKL